MMTEPSFQLMPKIRFMPAPVPEMLPMVKNRQARKTAQPTTVEATGPKYLRMAWMVGNPVVMASRLVVIMKVMPIKMMGMISQISA